MRGGLGSASALTADCPLLTRDTSVPGRVLPGEFKAQRYRRSEAKGSLHESLQINGAKSGIWKCALCDNVLQHCTQHN